MNYPYRRKGKNTMPIPLDKMTYEDKFFLKSFNFYEKKILPLDFDEYIQKNSTNMPNNIKRLSIKKKIKIRNSLKFSKISSENKVCNKSNIYNGPSNNYQNINENFNNFNKNWQITEKTNFIYSSLVLKTLRELYIINLLIISILETPFNNTI